MPTVCVSILWVVSKAIQLHCPVPIGSFRLPRRFVAPGRLPVVLADWSGYCAIDWASGSRALFCRIRSERVHAFSVNRMHLAHDGTLPESKAAVCLPTSAGYAWADNDTSPVDLLTRFRPMPYGLSAWRDSYYGIRPVCTPVCPGCILAPVFPAQCTPTVGCVMSDVCCYGYCC